MACGMCGGSTPARKVQTDVPGTVAVAVMMCPVCDTRTCGFTVGGDDKCDARVRDPYSKRCPRGHAL